MTESLIVDAAHGFGAIQAGTQDFTHEVRMVRSTWTKQPASQIMEQRDRHGMPFVVALATIAISTPTALAQDASARTVQCHSEDIVPIHAKLKYMALIEVPPTKKILEAGTGDKDFWVVDVVTNFCFVHPAKEGISSNLNLITDKGNIYSFTPQDVSGRSETPDLKVLVQPADHSSIVALTGPAQYVPASQLEQSKHELAALQTHVAAFTLITP